MSHSPSQHPEIPPAIAGLAPVRPARSRTPRSAGESALGEIEFCSASTLSTAIAAREISPVAVVERLLEQIERVDPAVNAFCLVLDEEALAAANSAERALYGDSPLGPLHGVPFAVKDLTATAGVSTTLGSRGVAAVDYRPPESALVYERLLDAGAILIGKTTTPEFGNKGTCDSPLLGRTNNPWDLGRTSGGSSGGSAAAVATGMIPLAEGSDGAGSVRIPASCCGVVGLKPSLGRVPIYPLASTFETMIAHGPVARTVRDAALMLDVIAGPDERDLFSLTTPERPFLSATTNPDLRGLRIAYSRNLGFAAVEPAVLEVTNLAARAFEEELGSHVEEADPDWEDSHQAEELIWSTVMGLGAHDFFMLLESPADMDPHLRALMDRGSRVSAWDFYRAAVGLRGQLYQAMRVLFERFDLLLTPTIAVEPFAHPEGQAPGPETVAGRPVDRFSGWFLTYPFNLTGHPAISVPCGFSKGGLPVGLQIVAPRHADAAAFAAAAAWERIRPWAEHRPRACD
jgi:aspartyl-tRNA(Asn)/glutamyl-tRNA(Gln) amidotransferase subunit A